MRILAAAFAATLLCACAAEPSPDAAQTCGDRAAIVAELGASFRETVTIVGVVSDEMVIEILVSPRGETWTILFTNSRGVSCFGSTGEHMRIRRGS